MILFHTSKIDLEIWNICVRSYIEKWRCVRSKISTILFSSMRETLWLLWSKESWYICLFSALNWKSLCFWNLAPLKQNFSYTQQVHMQILFISAPESLTPQIASDGAQAEFDALLKTGLVFGFDWFEKGDDLVCWELWVFAEVWSEIDFIVFENYALECLGL